MDTCKSQLTSFRNVVWMGAHTRIPSVVNPPYQIKQRSFAMQQQQNVNSTQNKP